MNELELHPLFNALLNTTSAILLFVGYGKIRAGARDAHKFSMLSAFVVSSVFLVSYLARFALAEGPKTFPGDGVWKIVYLGILFSHMILAAAVPVMAIVAIRYALQGEFERHKKWAKPAFPIWAYVSVTGVVVYAMLYHWPVA